MTKNQIDNPSGLRRSLQEEVSHLPANRKDVVSGHKQATGGGNTKTTTTKEGKSIYQSLEDQILHLEKGFNEQINAMKQNHSKIINDLENSVANKVEKIVETKMSESTNAVADLVTKRITAAMFKMFQAKKGIVVNPPHVGEEVITQGRGVTSHINQTDMLTQEGNNNPIVSQNTNQTPQNKQPLQGVNVYKPLYTNNPVDSTKQMFFALTEIEQTQDFTQDSPETINSGSTQESAHELTQRTTVPNMKANGTKTLHMSPNKQSQEISPTAQNTGMLQSFPPGYDTLNTKMTHSKNYETTSNADSTHDTTSLESRTGVK